jgi:hypothetical protein
MDNDQLIAERDRLRAALAGLLGADGADLEKLASRIPYQNAPTREKAVILDAIYALQDTAPDRNPRAVFSRACGRLARLARLLIPTGFQLT